MVVNNLIVVKSNEDVEANYTLSPGELKLLLMAISKLDSTEKLVASDKIRISATSFAELWNLPVKNVYRDLLRIEKQLFEREVVIDSWDKNGVFAPLKTRWISSVRYYKKEGSIEMSFSPDIVPYISKITKNFTKYPIADITGFKSTYGVRLYEMVLKWKVAGVLKISIKEFRERFQIEDGQYKRIQDLRIRCIEPAVKDINEYSPISIVNVVYNKRGQKIIGIEFFFKSKNRIELDRRSSKMASLAKELRLTVLNKETVAMDLNPTRETNRASFTLG
jgi:plasmid replication initiation protein